MRIQGLLVFAMAVVLEGFAANSPVLAQGGSDSDLLARVHFMGLNDIAADKTSAKFAEIAALPEGKVLRQEIVSKLATTPFRLMNMNSPPRQRDNAALIRPLVDDVLNSESYWELRQAGTTLPETVVAVRLAPARAGVWQANLMQVLKDWTGIPVKDIQVEGFKGWELRKHHNPNLFQFVRAGEWVVFSWGEDQLKLQPLVLRKIKETGRPGQADKKYWLDAWVNWPRFTAAHPNVLPIDLPETELKVEPRKDFLRPELKFRFAKPLDMKIEPWRIARSNIFSPVSSITLVRGFAPFLERQAWVRKLNAAPLPDQAVTWALPGNIAFVTCAMCPEDGGSSYLQKIAPGLISELNSEFKARDAAGHALLTTNMAVVIQGFPVLAPFLRVTNAPEGKFLFGGIFATPPATGAFPWESLDGIIAPKNVVYYDWEMNGERLFQWRALSQLYYMITARTLPKTDTAAQNWIMALKPKLTESRTIGSLTAPNELTFVRNAPVGLTGFELTCLAIWMDAPDFPLNAKAATVTPINARNLNPRH